MDRLREAWNQAKEEPETEQQKRAGVEPQRDSDSRYDRFHIETIVGIPEARTFVYAESKGDVRQYVAEGGSRINVDSNGQFYDGELRPIDRDAASSYQRMTTEWQGRAHDDTGQLMEHLKQFTQPAIDEYVQEQKLGGMHNASPAQQYELGERLQQRLGLAEESTSLAVIQQVMEKKEMHGRAFTMDDNMQHEHYLDTLRGKDGPNAMRESREMEFARSVAEPALEAFAAKNNVSVAQLTDEQVLQVGKEVSRHEQVPIAIATLEVKGAHWKAGDEADQRLDILERAVGRQIAEHYTWKQNSGDIESYQHNTTGRYVHLDGNSRFYDQSRTPSDATAALSHAEQTHTVAPYNELATGRLDTSRDERAMRFQTDWENKMDHTLPGSPASAKTETEVPKPQVLEAVQNPMHLGEKQLKNTIQEENSQRVGQQPDQQLSVGDRDIFRHNRILEYSVGADRTEQYEWKQTSGNIESFQNKETGKYLHADNEGRFYNQERKEIPQAAAIQHAEPDRLIAPAPNGIPIPVTQAANVEAVRSDLTVAVAPAIDKAPVQEHSLSM